MFWYEMHKGLVWPLFRVSLSSNYQLLGTHDAERRPAFLCKRHATKLDEAYKDLVESGYMLNAMIELTMSLSFSFKALTAFFLDTLACCMTSSMSLLSRPVSSTSSPSSSSSSSFLVSLVSMALPLP